MKKFLQWVKEASEPDMKTKLGQAVQEYLADKSDFPPKPGYYVSLPHSWPFDPQNPEHVARELGQDYDKSLPVKHGQHPYTFQCRGSARSLCDFLQKKGFKARVIAGWYGQPEDTYHTGASPSLDDSLPPQGFGRRPQEHWWVEAEGYYIDLTSAQFYPTSPARQGGVVIMSKEEALRSQTYLPVHRHPLGRAVRLPENVMRMLDKLADVKALRAGHLSNSSDFHKLEDWLRRNAPKYGLNDEQVFNLVAALGAMRRPGFYISDRKAMEQLCSEVFDDLEEDEGVRERWKNTPEYQPQFAKPGSRGILRVRRDALELSTSSNDAREKLEGAKRIVAGAWKGGIQFSPTEESSFPVQRGGTVFQARASMTVGGQPFEQLHRYDWDDAAVNAVTKALRDAGYKVDF